MFIVTAKNWLDFKQIFTDFALLLIWILCGLWQEGRVNNNNLKM